MKDHIGKNVLINCQNWFTAPDGKDYKSVWGKLAAIHEAGKMLGFIPNRSHANWFIEIGNMQIMGCQVLYFIACEDPPNFDVSDAWNTTDKFEIVNYKRPCVIYNANQLYSK